MSKFKNSLVKGLEEKLEQEAQNEKLKAKHDIKDDVVVVEKSNTFKFTVNILVNIIKTICTIALIILACIGLYLLILPVTRDIFVEDLQGVFKQVQEFIA